MLNAEPSVRSAAPRGAKDLPTPVTTSLCASDWLTVRPKRSADSNSSRVSDDHAGWAMMLGPFVSRLSRIARCMCGLE